MFGRAGCQSCFPGMVVFFFESVCMCVCVSECPCVCMSVCVCERLCFILINYLSIVTFLTRSVKMTFSLSTVGGKIVIGSLVLYRNIYSRHNYGLLQHLQLTIVKRITFLRGFANYCNSEIHN